MSDIGDGKRRELIVQMLKMNTSASIGEIAEQFRVSQMTIRRDLQKLVEAGQVIRIPGGARIEHWRGSERSFLERLQKMSHAKRSIGSAASALVRDGESVVLDSGTTTLYVARELRARSNVVVFTFSLSVLEELSSADTIRVELTGGVYRASSHDLIGHAVGKSLTAICADTVIFGAAAISFSRGVMVHDPDAQHELLQAGRISSFQRDIFKLLGGHDLLELSVRRFHLKAAGRNLNCGGARAYFQARVDVTVVIQL